MAKTVCFTGHRTIPRERYARIKALLDEVIENEITQGAMHFRTGGARGFDTLAALCVLSARVRHPEIRLELILPCPSQADGWIPSDVALYESILSMADTVSYVSREYYNGVMHERNRALVNGSDLCVTYLTTSHGGTAYTVSYAIKNGVDFINLLDRL